jgi:hypothetical protein
MTMTIRGLAEFLAARLDEDEAAAKAWLPFGNPDATNREHAARHDPARVLREVEAKRQILALHHPSPGLRHPVTDYHVDICAACDVPELPQAEWEHIDGFDGSIYPCDTVRALAAVWSDHPDFDPAWSL